MNHQPNGASPVLLHFAKVVAAAKGADALFCTVDGNIGSAAELIKVDLIVEQMFRLAYILPAGDLLADESVEGGKIDFLF